MKKTVIYLTTILLITACKKHEIRETKLPDGQLIEQFQVIENKDGSFIKDGYYKTWFENGQIESQGDYSNNKKTGIWKTWFDNGQIEMECSYKEDSLDGDFKKWFENNKVKATGKMNFGKCDGKWQTWYDNGQLESDENYLNGKSEGKFTYWYQNGQKRLEGEYKNGQQNGIWTWWDQDGKISRESNFKNNNDITLVGKWIDKDKDNWEFFEDGSYILTLTKKNEREKGTWSIKSDKLFIDNYDYEIKVLLKDSVNASHWTNDFWYGNRITKRLQVYRIH